MSTLSHCGYQGSVEVNLEDGVLHGQILHIPDLVAYQAETVPELQHAFREAVEDYLTTCQEEGRQAQTGIGPPD